jgi:hypothetical protein
MKINLVFLLFVIFLSGCGPVRENKQIVARINEYGITLDEFNNEFKNSSFAQNDTPDSKRDFLNNLINRKLILQDAQNKGLDKDKSFLKMIEKFWEQSLLKLAVERKTKDMANSVSVSDKEIEDAYNNMVKNGATQKPYDQMYQEIKWQITRDKGTQQLNDWVSQLHNKAQIQIDNDLLKQLK